MGSEVSKATSGWAVLVHLVGHHDLYLELDRETGDRLAVGHAGPATYSVGKALHAKLESGAHHLTASADGFVVTPPLELTWSRGDMEQRLEHRGARIDWAEPHGHVSHVRAPILSAVLQAHHAEWGDERKYALVLVSTGPVGEVRGRGQSTELVAKALASCLRLSGKGHDYEVHCRHFDTDTPHAFDALPAFIRDLTRLLAGYRRKVVAVDGPKWTERFSVALSVNTGPIPVITGLVTGTEEFHPTILHVSDARRWPWGPTGAPLHPTATRLNPDGLRQAPAVARSCYDDTPSVKLACSAMDEWRRHFRSERPVPAANGSGGKELNFWFRKGEQEVLAVLVVRNPERPDELLAIRGVNLEVSLPTGTLCAERNAIGTAFAAHPRLERKHVEAVAVLKLGSDPRLGPCGACMEWLRKMAEANPDLRVITFEDEDCSRIFVDAIP